MLRHPPPKPASPSSQEVRCRYFGFGKCGSLRAPGRSPTRWRPGEAGEQAGLAFDERWREAHVHAGPLPALFLQETARGLERRPARLSLFLGSDSPIARSNAFEGVQRERFGALRATRTPQFFFAADTGLHSAMFVDLAVTDACVDCHNEHPGTPKRDWRLGDVMGAVTRTYPAGNVTLEEAQCAVAALHQAVREAYRAYVIKAQGFPRPPETGGRSPLLPLTG